MRSSSKDLLDILSHVCSFKHLIAFIKNEELKIWKIQILLLDKLQDSSWGTHNDVGRFDSLELLNLILDWLSTIHYFCSEVWQVLCESEKLFLYLIGELSGVTHDQGWNWLWVIWQLVKNCQDKDCGLSHTSLSLTNDIDTDHCLRDALLLHFWGMLKCAINNCSLELRLKEKIFESCSMTCCISAQPKWESQFLKRVIAYLLLTA